jgi:hypothetical protein
MTLAEIIFFCLLLAGVYFLLGPLERRLEGWIYRRLKAIAKPTAEKPVIEINNYRKKD